MASCDFPLSTGPLQSSRGTGAHRSVASLQETQGGAAAHGLPPWTQTPPAHVSAPLQKSASSHDAPSAASTHADEQQSPSAKFPSSHCSPGSTTPFPQRRPVTGNDAKVQGGLGPVGVETVSVAENEVPAGSTMPRSTGGEHRGPEGPVRVKAPEAGSIVPVQGKSQIVAERVLPVCTNVPMSNPSPNCSSTPQDPFMSTWARAARGSAAHVKMPARHMLPML